ncbi:putative C6 transcription factor [Emericellopsis atlantica]|uniref:C6 transcription factor n=1 Tax=Emericellopsis atlantica TaxID=2614577 RepID=A0A9P8CP99_9HYPO|nr:putative C6 transcription factor [Emericellopsis atlantica]KAG9253905.1 putative C6 transcription factor [Emericellopsis atlantica]
MASASNGYSPDDEQRIRRNIACVSCRDSKVLSCTVKCRISPIPGDPCQRCAKLDISCVVNKSHRRTTKRSKMEKLEKDLDAIKQAVLPNVQHEQRALPPRPSSPRIGSCSSNSQSSTAQKSAFYPTPGAATADARVAASKCQMLSARAQRPWKASPSQPRTLDSHVVTGEDIDWYFDTYLGLFHPFVPVLAKRDPDECYAASPVLFWIIIFVVTRRHRRAGTSTNLFDALVEWLSKEIWTLPGSPLMGIEAVHAMLIICAWPLPTIRLVTDPSVVLSGAALNFCLSMGLHTGKGRHPEFCIGARSHFSSTDEEASCTWLMACSLAQRYADLANPLIEEYTEATTRTAAALGHPPPTIQLNDGPAKRALAAPEWADLITMFDIQRYLNRLHLAMASHIASNGHVVESLVSGWEDEFETVKSQLVRHDTELTRFLLLAAHQEIQAYYFCSPPHDASPNLAMHTTRALLTAKKVIAAAHALTAIPGIQLLTNAPLWVFHTIATSSVVLVSALHSHHPPPLDTPPEGVTPEQHLMNQCHAAVVACSIRDGDLAFRAATLMQGFWQCRDLAPKSDLATEAWPNRLGACALFRCLHRFQTTLHGAQRSSEGARKAVEAIQPPRPVDKLAPAPPQEATYTPRIMDPLQDIDWSTFLDDLGWDNGNDVFMGVS